MEEGFGGLVVIGLLIYMVYVLVVQWYSGRNRNKDD